MAESLLALTGRVPQTRGPASRAHVENAAAPGSATGGVRWLLRLEGLAFFAMAVAAYAQLDAGWGFFAALFLLPDLSFLAYLAGPRMGAAAYNAMHSWIGPLGLLATGMLAAPALTAVALVWCAHIGFDRLLGYGLKYSEGFGRTHLGRLGPQDPW
ncbi:hypothetical protein D9M73_33340 [compost metagenome]